MNAIKKTMKKILTLLTCVALSASCLPNLGVAFAETQEGEYILTGTPFGTRDWQNRGDTFDKAFDGKPAVGVNATAGSSDYTCFDANDGQNGYTGIELSEPKRVTKIMYYPRQTNLDRTAGCIFEGSNDGINYEPIYTISGASVAGTWYTVGINDFLTVDEFKYLRFRSPNTNCNIAEIAFFSNDDLRYTSLSLYVDDEKVVEKTHSVPPGKHTITALCKTDFPGGELKLEISRNGEVVDTETTDESSDDGLTIYTMEYELNAEEYYTDLTISSEYILEGESLASKSFHEKMYSIAAGDVGFFEEGDEIGFIGDSITHCSDANLETFEGLIYDYYVTHYPQKKLKIRNFGIGSATAYSTMYGANNFDALDYYLDNYPDMNKAVIMLGMNDMTNGSDSELAWYVQYMNELVDRLIEADVTPMLITPSIYDQTKNGATPPGQTGKNDWLVRASEKVREIAEEKNLKVIEFNPTMLEVNRLVQMDNIGATIIDRFGGDVVHPGSRGYAVMQYLFLRQQGADESILITPDANENVNATIDDVHNYSNYISFSYKVNMLPMAYTSGYQLMDDYVGFTKDLNQQIVRVEDLSEGTYEIKIDGASLGTYNADELEAGVNIAANKANPSQTVAMDIYNELLKNKSTPEYRLLDDIRYYMFPQYGTQITDESVKEAYKQSVETSINKAYEMAVAETEKEHRLVISKIDGDNSLMLPNIFSDNVVLQQGKTAIYGKGESGETYTVTLKNSDKTYTATAVAEDGKFRVEMTDTVASNKPFALTVESGNGEEFVDVYNVYIGDVYMLGGQSNMEQAIENATSHYWGSNETMTRIRNDVDRIMNENGSKIHFITQNQSAISNTPYFDVDLNPGLTKPWNLLEESTKNYISLLGMYFADDLIKAEELDYPIGLAVVSRGGTYISEWMSNGSGRYYNTHVAPFVGFGINGILWYQGENDSGRTSGNLRTYANATTQLINDYRKLWNDDDLPFVYMQLSVHGGNNYGEEDAPGDAYYTTRDEQRTIPEKVENKDNVGMIVTLDTASRPLVGGVHPDGKDIIGHRASNAIRSMVYGKKELKYTGPEYDGFTDNGDGTVTVKFKGNTEGMKLISTGDKEEAFFAAAGADKDYVKCTAEVVGDTVVLTPVSEINGEIYYVKYAMTNQPALTLFSGDGLPASPFISEKKIRITAIGDSITEGVGVYGVQGRGTGTYPMLMRDAVNNDPSFGVNYYVENRGYSGWCLANNSSSPYMLNSNGDVWNWAKNDRSDIYTIALGTNDAKYKHNDDGYKGNMQYVVNGEFADDYMEMIDGIKEYYSGAKIYLAMPVPSLDIIQDSWDTPGTINEVRLEIVRDEINKVYEEAKEKYGDSIQIIDFFEGFKEVIESDEPYEEAAAESKYTDTQSSDYASGSVKSFNVYGTANGKYLYDKNVGSFSEQLNIDTIHPGQAGARLMAQIYGKEITGFDIDLEAEPIDTTKHYPEKKDGVYFVEDVELSGAATADTLLTVGSVTVESGAESIAEAFGIVSGTTDAIDRVGSMDNFAGGSQWNGTVSTKINANDSGIYTIEVLGAIYNNQDKRSFSVNGAETGPFEKIVTTIDGYRIVKFTASVRLTAGENTVTITGGQNDGGASPSFVAFRVAALELKDASLSVSDKEITVDGNGVGNVYSIVYNEDGTLKSVEMFKVTENTQSFTFKNVPDVVYWWTNGMQPIVNAYVESEQPLLDRTYNLVGRDSISILGRESEPVFKAALFD